MASNGAQKRSYKHQDDAFRPRPKRIVYVKPDDLGFGPYEIHADDDKTAAEAVAERLSLHKSTGAIKEPLIWAVCGNVRVPVR